MKLSEQLRVLPNTQKVTLMADGVHTTNYAPLVKHEECYSWLQDYEVKQIHGMRGDDILYIDLVCRQKRLI